MTTLVRCCLILFVFAGSFSSCAEAVSRKHISLTSDVHNYYKTSSVFIMVAQLNRALDDYTVLNLLSREFSRRGILTLVINFMEVNEQITFYRKRMHRPLMVVWLRGKHDIDLFIRNTRTMVKSYPIWLVIFAGESGSPLCTYCKDPMANIFELRFDTQMLVMCCEDPILREWWSYGKNRTEKSVFASWTEQEGLKLLTPNAALSARRHNANGAELRIAIIPANTSTLVVDYGNNTVGGYFGEILHDLSRRLNFTITTTVREDRYGSWRGSNENWSGIVGQLVRENADIGVADFTMSNHRYDVIDYTLPLLSTESKLFIKKPDGYNVKWSAYLEAFTGGIWITILIIIITTPILLALIEFKGRSIPLSPLIFQNYLHIWGIFCQQGLSEFPAETPQKIAYFSIFISALVVYSSYSASLTSYLAVSSVTMPFTSLEGLMKDGSYKLITYQDSADYDFFATSTDSLLMQMMKIMKPKAELPGSAKEAWEQVCMERVALFANSAGRLLAQEHIKCEISEIDVGNRDSLAMIMTANNQYTKMINYHIQRFHGNGILQRLQHVHIGRIRTKKEIYYSVGLLGIAPVLLIFGCGIILAFVVLVCEQIYCSYLKNNTGKWPGIVNSSKTEMLRGINFRKTDGLVRRNLQPNQQWKTGLYNNTLIGYYP